jgi:hypothetical protein
LISSLSAAGFVFGAFFLLLGMVKELGAGWSEH